MIYFNRAGSWSGVKKTLQIIGWVVLSGAVTALLEWIGNLEINPSDYQLVAFVGIVNAVLAGIVKWLSIKR